MSKQKTPEQILEEQERLEAEESKAFEEWIVSVIGCPDEHVELEIEALQFDILLAEGQLTRMRGAEEILKHRLEKRKSQ